VVGRHKSSTGRNLRVVYPESFVPIPWVLTEHSEECKVYACLIEQRNVFDYTWRYNSLTSLIAPQHWHTPYRFTDRPCVFLIIVWNSGNTVTNRIQFTRHYTTVFLLRHSKRTNSNLVTINVYFHWERQLSRPLWPMDETRKSRRPSVPANV